MHIQNLYIYPVKSLGGIEVSEADVLQKGFRHDRRFMLVDDQNQFITQRNEHALALLQTEITVGGIRVYHKNNPQNELLIPFDIKTENTEKVTLWDDTFDAVFTGKKHDKWFSDFLQKPVRLAFLPEENPRPVDERYAGNGENVSLADGYPYLLIGQASLDDLNKRLPEPVPMNRFRPNLVVADADAFGEDTWAEIRIGDVHFKVAKPCARCVLTTINQNTGEKAEEPLATLSRYRLSGKKVLFGQNLIALNEGKIAVGDKLEVLRKK